MARLVIYKVLAVSIFVLYGTQFASAGRRRRVGSPEMMAAGMSGVITETDGITFEMEERGPAPCPRLPNNPFRTIDGTCNNLRNFGAAELPLRRLVEPANYEDGIEEPTERGASGAPLPSPRLVSETVHPDRLRTRGFTIMLMQWGQFLDHDMALTPIPTEGGIVITCCRLGNDGALPAFRRPEPCFPILFPAPDPDFRGSCMEFVRSDPAEEDYGSVNRTVRVREQLNALTAFIDGSMIYGSEEELARELREAGGRGFRLEVTRSPQGDLLPQRQINNCIRRPNTNDFCFLAGDQRVNEQPGLIVIHTMFVKLHNIVADALQRATPTRRNETIYQLARKIVGGAIQNVMYSEWLPIVLGRDTMDKYALTTGQRSQYNPAVDPTILTEFSTAAYRMGHSLVPNSLPAGFTRLRLRDHFLRPQVVVRRFQDIARGLVNGSGDASDREAVARNVDRFVASELTEHLFEPAGKPRQGFDLVSFNIQRGRDHGLPSYNDVRRQCGFNPVRRFTDRAFATTDGARLAEVYATPDDIELFPGGLAERPVDGGLLGPTFTCIIATQMQLLKFGDRYFFEHSQFPEGFTNTQLSIIRRFTMSAIVCLTVNIDQIQRNAFRVPSTRNPLVSCSSLINAIDLSRIG